MSKNSRPKKKTNRFKAAGLRAPGSLPNSVQWKLEGDAAFMKTLDDPTAIWMASFLEAEFGDNPSVFGYDVEKSREVWNRSKANGRDVMTIIPRGSNRVDLDDYGISGTPPTQSSATPNKLQKRVKQHPGLCTGGSVNPTEDALIEALDLNVIRQQIKPPVTRARIKKRKSGSVPKTPR